MNASRIFGEEHVDLSKLFRRGNVFSGTELLRLLDDKDHVRSDGKLEEILTELFSLPVGEVLNFLNYFDHFNEEGHYIFISRDLSSFYNVSGISEIDRIDYKRRDLRNLTLPFRGCFLTFIYSENFVPPEYNPEILLDGLAPVDEVLKEALTEVIKPRGNGTNGGLHYHLP